MQRPRVTDLHPHLVCVLCGGYFVDATTIVECLHSFCRSCIVRYLETCKFCPMCEVQVHKTKPLLNLRPDKTLQSLVYKAVPGVYGTEMKRRREYYTKLKEKGAEGTSSTEISPEDRGEPENPEIFSPEDSISLSLEYYNGVDDDEDEVEQKTAAAEGGGEVKKKEDEDDGQAINKRYLKCPAAVCMRHLKKFVRLKFGLSQDFKVDIIYKGECLREEFTLIDVAYTFCWNREKAMRFSYRIYERPRITHAVGVTNTNRSISDNHGGEEPPVKRSRLLSSEGTSSAATHTSTQHKSAKSPSDEEEQPPPPQQPPEDASDVPSEKLRPRVSADAKRTESVPPPPPPARPKTPKERSSSMESKKEPSAAKTTVPKASAPKAAAAAPKAAAAAPKASAKSATPKGKTPAKVLSPPPKPIMPGQKPPSQTALLLQQRIMQQRQKLQMQKQQQQQQQKLQMQQQKQLQAQQQKQLQSAQQKQMPSLQKLQPAQKASSQLKLNKPSAAAPQPAPAAKPAVSSSATHASTSSKPALVQNAQISKPPASAKSPAPQASKSPAPPAPKSVPTNSAPAAPKPASQAPVANKPAAAAQSAPASKPSTSSAAKPEVRRDDSNLIEKSKMSPVVVIERHTKKLGSPPPIKSLPPTPAPSNKEKNEHKPSTLSSATTLAVAPGSTITKLKLVKRPATSPADKPPVAKKAASETPRPAPPLGPLEVRTKQGEERHDDIGALDLSGKSSRKSDSPCSSHSSGAASPPAPSPTEPRTSPAPHKPTSTAVRGASKPNKSQSPQTIMSIAQTLVNRQLSSLAFNGDTGGRSPNSPHSQGSSSPSSQGSTSGGGSGFNFRNLMTLTDTAVQVLSQQRGPPPVSQQRMRPPVPQQTGPRPSNTPRAAAPNSNGKGVPNPIRIPSVPPAALSKASPPRPENNPMLLPNRVPRINDLFPGPQSKPVQNQSVRHIPNPSLLFRQQANRMQQQQQLQQQTRKEAADVTPARGPATSPLSSIRKIENLTRNICEGKASLSPGLGTRVESTQ